MNDRASWLAARKQGIGGSDVAAILGMHPYMSPVQLWANKTGRAPDSESAMRLRFGQFGEAFVANEYELATGRRTLRHNAMLRHPDYPMAIGNVDRLVVPEGRKVAAIRGQIVADRLLEAKTVSSFSDREQWGDPGTDAVPIHYLLQTHWYLALTPCHAADLAALFGSGEELVIYTIRKDADLEEELLRRASEWWQRHVIGDEAPEPVNEEDVALLYPQAKAKPVVATDEIAFHVARLRRCKAAEKHLERIQSEHALAVKAFMGDADTLLAPAAKGEKATRLVTWNNRKGRTTFDLEAFVGLMCPGATKAEHSLFIEDAYRTFTTRGAPGRTFLLKESK